MSPAEHRLLDTFRKYLMTPGRMLCLNSQQLQSYRVAIVKLIENDLLTKESYKGGYSLTEAGYEMMKDMAKPSVQQTSSSTKTPQLPKSSNRLVRKHK